MADKKVELDDLFVEELKPRATPISTVVATECCGVCNSSCREGQEPVKIPVLGADTEAEFGANLGAEPARGRTQDTDE